MELLVDISVVVIALGVWGILGGCVSLGYYLRDIARALEALAKKGGEKS